MDEKKTDEMPTGVKNENEKMHDWHGHHMHGGKMVVGAVVFVLILGGIFALGRMSGRGFHRIGTERNITIERGNFGAMGGRGMMGGGERIGRAGISGSITKIDGNTLTIKTSSQDVTAVVLSTTSIRKSDGTIGKQSDLAVNNNVTVSGPSDSTGNINANFIVIR